LNTSTATTVLYKKRDSRNKKKERDESLNRSSSRRDRYEDLGESNYTGKRVIDLLVGSIGLLAFTVIYPFIAIGIKLTSPGPVLFKQKRTGMFGEEFTCYKFRTMHVVNKERRDGKPVITEIGDSRIFSFGQFLRKSNLDELPQILNVIKGDMSLVGPRPYPVQECRYWDEVFDDHFYRYTTTPGITGLAQARGYRGGTLDEEEMRRRLNFDLIYTEKNNLFLDLKLIWKTVYQMIVRDTKAH